MRRFESGRYAVDSESRRIYQRALELVEVFVVIHYPMQYTCTVGSHLSEQYGTKRCLLMVQLYVLMSIKSFMPYYYTVYLIDHLEESFRMFQ